MFTKRQISVIWLVVLLAIFPTACKKKAPPPPPPPPPVVQPPPPPPAAPTVTNFSAEPSSIERGQSSTLSWSVENATSISIDNGIGTVQATGSRRVFPNDSTTYTLTANGPGGSKTATATVNVTAPPPPAPPPPAEKPSLDQRMSELKDCYFDYDKSDVRPDCRDALTQDANILKSILTDFPNTVIQVEGNCDQRGSAEYNLGLGDRRATSAKDFLVSLGVAGDKLKTISYGKERPVCTDENEDCYQRNRHVHFAPAP